MLKRKPYPFTTPFSQRLSPIPAQPKSVIDEPFEKALRLAEAKISKGDLSGASLLIKSYLPLLTTRQKKRIVNVLDPYAENMFRKAYILKAFDRRTSDKMLEMLAEDGLGLLPRKGPGSYLSYKGFEGTGAVVQLLYNKP